MKHCGKVKPGSTKRQNGATVELRCVHPKDHIQSHCRFVWHVKGGKLQSYDTEDL